MVFPVSAPQRILENLDGGRLPVGPPEKMYAGYGSWNICDGCGEIIHPAQVEYIGDSVTRPDGRCPRAVRKDNA